MLLAMALLRLACRETPHGEPGGAPDSNSTAEPKAIRSPPPTESRRPKPAPIDGEKAAATLAEQRERLFRRLARESGFTDASLARVREIFEASPVLGQGNPALTRHPMSRRQCQEVRAADTDSFQESTRCEAKHMVTVYDPGAGETEKTARLCIDQFEFPNLPCEYPVVHVRAREAALLCEAVGKRLCDAHEWEGACAGALRPVEQEYAWGASRRTMTWRHNREREIVWAYGPTKDHAKCAMGSTKAESCPGGYTRCSSNTYPAGAFPACVSPLGVYDQHGNAAEHMNLPLAPDQLSGRGKYGATEMKGSWFIFATHEAHEDDCRWRAKDWHPSLVMAPDSHRNYHLGFRCCKTVELRR
jgi:formylglycine-generating enzyme